MQQFVDDDNGYIRWLAGHPDGFVLNTERTPKASYLMLHRSTCHSISQLSGRATQWTGPYIKHCGDRGELETVARHQFGGEPSPCGHCLR